MQDAGPLPRAGQAAGIIADYAVEAAKKCLEVNDVSLDEVDLVIGGSIARQYFEPATAMEVAAKLGLKRTHAFDVTAACVGHLEAIQTAAGYLALHDDYRTALVFTSELSGWFLSYDIQNVRDLQMKTAGLTIGNAAACVLVRGNLSRTAGSNSRRSTRSRRPTTGTSVRSRSTARWSRRPSS